MTLPIVGYGDPILRAKAQPITENSAELQQLIDDMIETMKGADGAGLAAPQVGQSIRLFVADLTTAWQALSPEERPPIPPQPMVCINPEMIARTVDEVEFGEGCLFIPALVEYVRRPVGVRMRYLDRDFRPHEITGISYTASVLQHEYDHLNGVLHIDYLSNERKQQIQEKLQAIEMGFVQPDYPMRFFRSSES